MSRVEGRRWVPAAAEVTEPLLRHHRCRRKDDDEAPEPEIQDEEAAWDQCEGGSLRMVLLSTAVAVCGSFEFGTCVSRRLN
jgi:MFS transporter, SP family, ERD6-like sugar transporter